MKVSASRFVALCSSFFSSRNLKACMPSRTSRMISFASESIVPIVGREAAGLGEKILGILAHAELAVAICKDAAIESRADQGVLEAPLEEVLDDQGLELDFDLEFGHLALELIGSDQRGDLRKPRQNGLHLHFAAELLRCC